MSTNEMAKAFDPKGFEAEIYDFWQKGNYFAPRDGAGDPFVVVIPPPNVTGILHMGHGLNNSLQDILIRFYRMKGRPTLWIPGTDHAGIATQHVVEKRLKANGKSRRDMGREAFLKETWKVKEEHHGVISKQLRKIGSSCDWDRERFTLDDGLSESVREVFVSLYKKDLIYRGNYLVNWCPSCGTALADDEVEHQQKTGGLYRVKYPLADGSGELVVATTRPETMFGDTAVAVHPEDERFKGFIGKNILLPLTDREIPIIGDPYVDREFGTGALKITPAHDPNDWEIGMRHNLPRLNILNADGTLNENVPQALQGMKSDEARKETLVMLKARGFFIDSSDHDHQVGHCYRCSTVIEPYMSTQWFVRMQGMADKALKAWKDGDIRFYPQRWENTYRNWLENIRDWCISRQLWWGHRIPVFYCNDCGETIVEHDDPSVCPKCSSENLRQDEDVLDTWFSSWLWPFSTMGWPEKTEDFEKFFPTSALVTAYDIIFFWVARMIMASLEFLGKVPFKDIYIHQLVRDIQGRKMSKSLGNGLDPLEIVEEYGADALKFTLSFMAAQGQDILVDKETFKLGSKFANKIWNASRYILMNHEEGTELVSIDQAEKKPVDLWILHRLATASADVEKAIAAYKFNDAAHVVYEYFWNEFCDWYIEASKISLYSKDPGEKQRAISILLHLLKESLKLLHPFLPFLTEEIFQKLPDHGEALIIESYPNGDSGKGQAEAAEHFSRLQELIRQVRTMRSEFKIAPEKKIRLSVKLDDGFTSADFFGAHQDLVASLAGCSEVVISHQPEGIDAAVPIAGSGYVAYVFVRDVMDVEAELAKMTKELANLSKLKTGTEKKLSNENFLSRAPEDVIEKEKSKLAEFGEKISKIEEILSLLK